MRHQSAHGQKKHRQKEGGSIEVGLWRRGGRLGVFGWGGEGRLDGVVWGGGGRGGGAGGWGLGGWGGPKPRPPSATNYRYFQCMPGLGNTSGQKAKRSRPSTRQTNKLFGNIQILCSFGEPAHSPVHSDSFTSFALSFSFLGMCPECFNTRSLM